MLLLLLSAMEATVKFRDKREPIKKANASQELRNDSGETKILLLYTIFIIYNVFVMIHF